MPFSQPLTVAKRAVQNRGNQTHSRLPSAHQSWTKPQLHFLAINGYPYRLFHQEVGVSHLPFRTSGVKRKGKDGTYETHALIYKIYKWAIYDGLWLTTANGKEIGTMQTDFSSMFLPKNVVLSFYKHFLLALSLLWSMLLNFCVPSILVRFWILVFLPDFYNATLEIFEAAMPGKLL